MNISLFAPLYPYEDVLIDHFAFAPFRLAYRHFEEIHQATDTWKQITHLVCAILHILLPYVFYGVERSLSRWSFSSQDVHPSLKETTSSTEKSVCHSFRITDLYDSSLDQFVNVDMQIETSPTKNSIKFYARIGETLLANCDESWAAPLEANSDTPLPDQLTSLISTYQKVSSSLGSLKGENLSPNLIQNFDATFGELILSLFSQSIVTKTGISNEYLKETLQRCIQDSRDTIIKASSLEEESSAIQTATTFVHNLLKQEIQSKITSDSKSFWTGFLRNLKLETSSLIELFSHRLATNAHLTSELETLVKIIIGYSKKAPNFYSADYLQRHLSKELSTKTVDTEYATEKPTLLSFQVTDLYDPKHNHFITVVLEVEDLVVNPKTIDVDSDDEDSPQPETLSHRESTYSIKLYAKKGDEVLANWQESYSTRFPDGFLISQDSFPPQLPFLVLNHQKALKVFNNLQTDSPFLPLNIEEDLNHIFERPFLALLIKLTLSKTKEISTFLNASLTQKFKNILRENLQKAIEAEQIQESLQQQEPQEERTFIQQKIDQLNSSIPKEIQNSIFHLPEIQQFLNNSLQGLNIETPYLKNAFLKKVSPYLTWNEIFKAIQTEMEGFVKTTLESSHKAHKRLFTQIVSEWETNAPQFFKEPLNQIYEEGFNEIREIFQTARTRGSLSAEYTMHQANEAFNTLQKKLQEKIDELSSSYWATLPDWVQQRNNESLWFRALNKITESILEPLLERSEEEYDTERGSFIQFSYTWYTRASSASSHNTSSSSSNNTSSSNNSSSSSNDNTSSSNDPKPPALDTFRAGIQRAIQYLKNIIKEATKDKNVKLTPKQEIALFTFKKNLDILTEAQTSPSCFTGSNSLGSVYRKAILYLKVEQDSSEYIAFCSACTELGLRR